MPTRIQTLLWVILITVLTAIPTLSQETPKTGFAPGSRTIQVAANGAKDTDCESELAAANQRLLKTLDALSQAEKAIEALKAEIAARESLDKINEEILKRKELIITEQQKLIAILEKQTGRKISFLFGLIKVRF